MAQRFYVKQLSKFMLFVIICHRKRWKIRIHSNNSYFCEQNSSKCKCPTNNNEQKTIINNENSPLFHLVAILEPRPLSAGIPGQYRAHLCGLSTVNDRCHRFGGRNALDFLICRILHYFSIC